MMRKSYAIGSDEWYSIDVTLDPFGMSYADILVFGSKGKPKAHSFSDRDVRKLLKTILRDMDLYHVKLANVIRFKTEYIERALECGCAENCTQSNRKGQS